MAVIAFDFVLILTLKVVGSVSVHSSFHLFTRVNINEAKTVSV